MNHVFHIMAQQLFRLNLSSLPLLRTTNSRIKDSNPQVFLLILFLSGLLACTDSRSDDFQIVSTTSSFDYHSIEYYNGILFATGGDVWNRSNLATSADAINWEIDSLTNKSIFDLYTDNLTLYGVGNDGYIFSGESSLKLSRTRHWGLLRSFTASQEGFIAAGGKDFNKGWIYKVNSDLKIDTTYKFENEILTVNCNSTGRCIAAGYGIILVSDDSGSSWQRSNEDGDFYNAIAINSNDEFFIVGYNGTIITSKDNGESWQKIKNGHSPLANNKPFRSIKFEGDKGVIIGDNGLIWSSSNAGSDWTDKSIDTDMDLFDFAFYGSKMVCVSEMGQIFVVNI